MVHGRQSLVCPGPGSVAAREPLGQSRCLSTVGMLSTTNVLCRACPSDSSASLGSAMSACLACLMAGWRARLLASGPHSPGETRRVIIRRSASTGNQPASQGSGNGTAACLAGWRARLCRLANRKAPACSPVMECTTRRLGIYLPGWLAGARTIQPGRDAYSNKYVLKR